MTIRRKGLFALLLAAVFALALAFMWAWKITLIQWPFAVIAQLVLAACAAAIIFFAQLWNWKE
jgi:hypothetical protein